MTKHKLYNAAYQDLLAQKSDQTLGNVTLSNEAVAEILKPNTDAPIFAESRLLTFKANNGVLTAILKNDNKKRGLKRFRNADGTRNDISHAKTIGDKTIVLHGVASNVRIDVDQNSLIDSQFDAKFLLLESLSEDVTPAIEYHGLFNIIGHADADLAQYDGVIAQSAKIYGQDATDGTLADYDNASTVSSVFASLLAKYDKTYMALNKMVYYVSHDVYFKYIAERKATQTIEINEYVGGLKFDGIPLVVVPNLDDTEVTAILTHKHNIYYAVNTHKVVAEYEDDAFGVDLSTYIEMSAGVEKSTATVVAIDAPKPKA